MRQIELVRSAIREGGWGRVISLATSNIYRRSLRRLLPTTGHVLYNGVPIDKPLKPLDRTLSSNWLRLDLDDDPAYESGLIQAIHEQVRPGDTVVIVGGGWGVTTVRASQAAGSKGSIVVFEAGVERVENIHETILLSETPAPVQVIHGLVGSSSKLVVGAPDDAQQWEPANLPQCSVLELDCEGAELEILRNMEICPRAVLVESHGVYGSTSSEVRRTLERQGYQIVSEVVAESSQEDYCRENDIMVLQAVFG